MFLTATLNMAGSSDERISGSLSLIGFAEPHSPPPDSPSAGSCIRSKSSAAPNGLLITSTYPAPASSLAIAIRSRWVAVLPLPR